MIGIFDSGIGGLTVVRALRRELPSVDLIYYGDTARVPYGSKSPQTVRRYSTELTERLLEHHVELIIVACNTASAVALSQLRSWFKVPIIGVIEPGARAAAERSMSGRIGVIGTRATVASSAYTEAIHRSRADASVFSRACPLFVPLVEEGWSADAIAREVAHRYLDDLIAEGIDALVLGCTHYPLLRDIITEVVGKEIVIIDSATETAHEVAKLFEKRVAQPGNHHLQLYASDDVDRFQRLGELFLGERIESVTQFDV